MEKHESLPFKYKIQKCQMPSLWFTNIAGKHYRNTKAIEINTKTTINREKEDMKTLVFAYKTFIYLESDSRKNITDNKSENRA